MINTEAQRLLKEDLLGKYEEMKTIRARYEPAWKEVTEKMKPRRSIWEIDDEGEPPRPKMYNSHAVWAAKTHTQGFVGYMVSRSRPWFKLVIEGQETEEYGVRDWLDVVQMKVLSALNESNFHEANYEIVDDAGVIGSGTMYSEEDLKSKKIYFTTRHPKEVYFSSNNFGQVDTVFRYSRITNRQAKQQFGDKNCPEQLLAAKDHPSGYVHILHIVMPRADRDPGKAILSKNKAYASIYIDVDHSHFLAESGYDTFPYFCYRYSKNSDEEYGRGPGIDAYYDTLMINQVAKTRLDHAQKVSNPPLNIPQYMKGEERVLPGGHNYVEGNDQITAVNLGGNYPINADIEQKIEDVIDKHFNVKFFTAISSMEREMTAREVSERKGEQAAMLGTAGDRYEHEVAGPVIERVYRILDARGDIPPPPEALMTSGAKITIIYTGYLSQLSKAYYQTAGIESAMGFLQAAATMNPAILDNVDMDVMTRNTLDGYGRPADEIREIKDIKNIRSARQQAQDQQAQAQTDLEQQKIIAGNADKLNQPIQKGTPLDALAQQGARK